MRATTATGAMYISRLRLSMRSLESDSMRPCGTRVVGALLPTQADRQGWWQASGAERHRQAV